jgi:hypothetical protein
MWKLCALYSGIQFCSFVAPCKSEATSTRMQNAAGMPHDFHLSCDTDGEL